MDPSRSSGFKILSIWPNTYNIHCLLHGQDQQSHTAKNLLLRRCLDHMVPYTYYSYVRVHPSAATISSSLILSRILDCGEVRIAVWTAKPNGNESFPTHNPNQVGHTIPSHVELHHYASPALV